MRLFDGEVRTDSITGSASGRNDSTQASNFSLCMRSGMLPVMATASIPNCLKQSDKRERVGSLISTRATRAEAFLLGGGAARTLPDAFRMAMGNALKLHSGLRFTTWQRVRRTVSRYQGLITGNELPGKVRLAKPELSATYMPSEMRIC